METAKQIRIENYYNTVDLHPKQDEEVLRIVALHKQGIGASGIFLYLNEKYPLTSIRRSLNTLLNQGKIIENGKVNSVLYNSTETSYKFKVHTDGLF